MERVFADVVAAVVIASLLLFIGAILISFQGATAASVGAIWLTLYSLVVVMSATRLYGRGVLSAAAKVVQGAANNSQ